MQFQLMNILSCKPPKNLHKSVVEYQLDCVHVNKVYKKLETLYLRKKNKNILTNLLDKFRNKRELYTELGIPYKLGMMFHGIPGTGKTTAIKAVASYLKKDIYFVHLKNVKTNADLKAMFDHINNKCNGGVIVFEDIDAATDVVYQRDNGDPHAYTMADCLDEDGDQLTLSYLLNLLDGTLSTDGTIFAITTNHLEKLDPALYRKGRVDVCIQFQLCDHYQMQQIYQSILGRLIPEDILLQIPENKYPPCDVIFQVHQHMLDDEISDLEIMAPFLQEASDDESVPALIDE